jgi:DNA-binding protein HU-beta
MNKTELIAAAAERTGMGKKDVERVINAAIGTITTELKEGRKVQLTGFGIFETKHRAARVGRNPATKEPMEIAATNIPSFKPAKALKDTVGG